jgi:hypothetical protein
MQISNAMMRSERVLSQGQSGIERFHPGVYLNGRLRFSWTEAGDWGNRTF